MRELTNILGRLPRSSKRDEAIKELECLGISIADKHGSRVIARNSRVCLEVGLELLAQSRTRDKLQRPPHSVRTGKAPLADWATQVAEKIEPNNQSISRTLRNLVEVGNIASHSPDMSDWQKKLFQEITQRPIEKIWNPLIGFLFTGLSIDAEVPLPSGDKKNLIAQNTKLKEKLEEEERQKDAIRASLKRTEDKISDREDQVQELEKDKRLRSVFRQDDSTSQENARNLAKYFIEKYSTEATSGRAKAIVEAAQSTTDPIALEKIKLLQEAKKEADRRTTQKAEESEKFQEEIINLKEERTKLLSQIDSYSPWSADYPFKDGEPNWASASSMLDQRIKESEAPFSDYKFIRTVSDNLLGKHGTVYKARHKNGQTVAIKLPRRLDASYHYEAAFYRKALKAKQPIPGLIQPVPDGIAPSTTPGHIILQWEDGLRLDEWVREHEGALKRDGRLLAVALKHGEQILTTLQALWNEKLIFTDLHPGNVMMRKGDRPILLDPGGLVAASSLPELETMEALITGHDSIEELPKLRRSQLKTLAAMYLAMTTDLILYIASGGAREVLTSTETTSEHVDQRKKRNNEIRHILHNSEVLPQGEDYDDRIERGRESLTQLFQDWRDAGFREEACNSSRGPHVWFNDYRRILLNLIDPYKAYRQI